MRIRAKFHDRFMRVSKRELLNYLGYKYYTGKKEEFERQKI